MTELPSTPGQTVGPFFGFALPFEGDSVLVPARAPGALLLHGRVYDGAGEPVPDALVELWQVDETGDVVRRPGSLQRDDDTFTGWGRCGTDGIGRYAFSTVAPAAPFFAITVFARGLQDRLFTRAYLPSAADDPFLESVAPDRRATLLASADARGFRFDIRLQGDGETVFLRYPRH